MVDEDLDVGTTRGTQARLIDVSTPPVVLDLDQVDRTHAALVGGKGANLGELSTIVGVRVPAGFCVTTEAFRRIATAAGPSIDGRIDELSTLHPADDRHAITALSSEIRAIIEHTEIPADVTVAITRSLTRFGADAEYAVRSSATAEDLLSASFAGQHDSSLNVIGTTAILDHVRRCWASLYSDRAVAYRQRNGFGHRTVLMAVVVQRMVVPHASGVLFTADPITSNRRITAVEACFGLGEALVAGAVEADAYTLRDGTIISRSIAGRRDTTNSTTSGGARVIEPTLTDAQVVRLEQLGRRLEAHFGRPQDIEWCLVGDEVHVVQSRPITTLFPIPDAGDDELHVFVSVGHQQMMTDPMKPLGLSLFQSTALRPMYVAGGRLFVDVAALLVAPSTRADILDALGTSDPLIGDALRTIVDRGDILSVIPGDGPAAMPAAGGRSQPSDLDPAVVGELIERNQASVAELRQTIRTLSGPELLRFIREDVHELKQHLFDPQSRLATMAGMEAAGWLNDRLQEWLGEKNAADALTQSVPHNVTSEMGLALLDVADAIRPHPAVVAFLQRVEDDGFLEELGEVAGGQAARDAIQTFLDRYGMRCVGEIDITRPRWSERPSTLVPIILGNVRQFEPGAGERRYERGRTDAAEKERDLLERLRALPDGDRKAAQSKRMIDQIRSFAGYREYPKYGLISRYAVYKQALMAEADRLVQAGLLLEREDIFFLTVDELHHVVDMNEVDDRLIRHRQDEFRSYEMLTPPRVMTSDGEVVVGTYRRDDVPTAALIGLAVSGGTVEGRARIVADLAAADLEPGDILVTTYTDPSFTPLFVAIAGLVTEVGGLMTHGAVIAREYGLPAVVGVERATVLIRDGQQIRVHGTDGYVEILGPPDVAAGHETN